VLSDQQRARIFGVLFLITFVTSIPALVLFQPVLDDPVGYIASAGQDNRIFFGALLELLLIIANIGTAVVIFPVVKRQSEELALGYVTARLFECTFILVGIVAVLGIATLQQEVAGAAEGSIAYTLAALKGLDVLARAGLGRRLGERPDPRLPHVRLGPGAAQDGGARPRRGPAHHPLGHPRHVRRRRPRRPLQGIATIPEALWELSLGIYCTVKGFRPESPILQANAREHRRDAMPAATPA
jgi:Domain of unknown function (DUF4386)